VGLRTEGVDLATDLVAAVVPHRPRVRLKTPRRRCERCCTTNRICAQGTGVVDPKRTTLMYSKTSSMLRFNLMLAVESGAVKPAMS
jgi:hypothetical protein